MNVVEGRGLVAVRNLAPGELIFDPTVVFCCGKPPADGYKYIHLSGKTFFQLKSEDKSAYTFFTNTKTEHSINIKWVVKFSPAAAARARERDAREWREIPSLASAHDESRATTARLCARFILGARAGTASGGCSSRGKGQRPTTV